MLWITVEANGCNEYGVCGDNSGWGWKWRQRKRPGQGFFRKK